MQTYILKDGQQQGPYTAEELDELLKREAIDADTLFWQEGRTDWAPLSQFPGFVPSPNAASISQSTEAQPLANAAPDAVPSVASSGVKPSSNKAKYVGIGLVAVLLLAGGVIALLSKLSSHKPPPIDTPRVTASAAGESLPNASPTPPVAAQEVQPMQTPSLGSVDPQPSASPAPTAAAATASTRPAFKNIDEAAKSLGAPDQLLANFPQLEKGHYYRHVAKVFQMTDTFLLVSRLPLDDGNQVPWGVLQFEDPSKLDSISISKGDIVTAVVRFEGFKTMQMESGEETRLAIFDCAAVMDGMNAQFVDCSADEEAPAKQ